MMAGVAHGHPYPPTGHVVGLGERVELDPHLACAFRLQEAGRPVRVEGYLRIRSVVEDRKPVAPGEGRRPLEEVDVGYGAGRVVGVVQPEQPGPSQYVLRHRVQVRQELVFLPQRQVVGLAAGEHRPYGVHRVAGVGHERHVSGIDEAEGDVADPLLGADEGQHLFLGVQLDAKPPLVPSGDRLSQLRQAVRFRVAVVGRVQ